MNRTLILIGVLVLLTIGVALYFLATGS